MTHLTPILLIPAYVAFALFIAVSLAVLVNRVRHGEDRVRAERESGGGLRAKCTGETVGGQDRAASTSVHFGLGFDASETELRHRAKSAVSKHF